MFLPSVGASTNLSDADGDLECAYLPCPTDGERGRPCSNDDSAMSELCEVARGRPWKAASAPRYGGGGAGG